MQKEAVYMGSLAKLLVLGKTSSNLSKKMKTMCLNLSENYPTIGFSGTLLPARTMLSPAPSLNCFHCIA